MSYLRLIFLSSLAKKIVTGVTGFVVIFYTLVHLAGNSLLFFGNPNLFNSYAEFLTGFGWFTVLVELVLAGFFLFHSIAGVIVWIDKKRARRQGYAVTDMAGPPSKMTLSSRTMIISGVILFAFLILHVAAFRLGPAEAEGYVTQLDGKEARDLYRLVVELFSDKIIVIWYMFAMVFLGFHIRHGFWSMFQSLGLNRPGFIQFLYIAAIFIAVILAAGFFIIPLWIFFTGGAA